MAGIPSSQSFAGQESLPCTRGPKHRATFHCDRLTLHQTDAAEFLREARDVKRPWAQLQWRCPKDRPVPLHVVTRHHLHQRYGRWRFGSVARRKMGDGESHGRFVSCPDRSSFEMCRAIFRKIPGGVGGAISRKRAAEPDFTRNHPAAKVERLALKALQDSRTQTSALRSTRSTSLCPLPAQGRSRSRGPKFTLKGSSL